MNLKILKNLFIYFLLFTPISLGVISCSGNNKSSSKFKEEINADIIPPITAVAALGQLTPAGEIRQLAAPISQFGSSPRIVDILVNEGDFVKKGDILAIFENREKLISDLEINKNLINTINEEIILKKDQIQRYELALKKDVYSFVEFSQRKDELLKQQKHKINLIGDQKNIKIDLFNSKLRSPINGFILGINTRVGERPQNEGILDIGSSQQMEALIAVYESDIDRVFISQNVELSSENGGFQKNLK